MVPFGGSLTETSQMGYLWNFWVVQMTVGLLEVNGSKEGSGEAEHQATLTTTVVWLSLKTHFCKELSHMKCHIWAREPKDVHRCEKIPMGKTHL